MTSSRTSKDVCLLHEGGGVPSLWQVQLAGWLESHHNLGIIRTGSGGTRSGAGDGTFAVCVVSLYVCLGEGGGPGR